MAIRSTASVTVRDLGWNQIKRNARSLNRQGVVAGILPRDASTRGVSRDWNGNLIPGTARVADYAVWNEFGVRSSHVTIPARPFMRRTAVMNRRQAGDMAARVADHVLIGRTSLALGLDRLGQWYVARIRDTIDTAIRWAVPLSPVTVARKGHDLPLIDFGLLRAVINYARRRR